MTLEEFCGKSDDDRKAIASCLEPKLSALKGALAPTMATLNAKTIPELGEKLCAEFKKDPGFAPIFGGDPEKNKAEFLTALDACA